MNLLNALIYFWEVRTCMAKTNQKKVLCISGVPLYIVVIYIAT